MSRSIFIAYSHKDTTWEQRVQSHLGVIRHALPDIDIWDDRRIGVGQYWEREIDKSIASAQVALLLVSDRFLTSDFIVRREVPEIILRHAKHGLTVIPLIVRACAWQTVPWLKGLQCRPLNGRPLAELGRKTDGALASLATEIAELLGPRASSNSLGRTEVSVCASRFPLHEQLLPLFFPSVSGAAKSMLSPLDHMRLLVKFGYPCFLASVYDFANANRDDRLAMGTLAAQATESGQTLLLDSGLYERKWLRDPRWSRPRFLSTLASIPCSLAFCYDTMRERANSTAGAEIAAQVLQDRRKAGLESIFPIVHGTPLDIPALAKDVVSRLDSPLIAVAERELGDGLLAGATTMIALRRSLNETGARRLIHVLGTGNPLSILVYSACGADSFDGLDWCQTVADFGSKHLFHSRQLDLCAGQSLFSDDTTMSYPTRMLAHNLSFFAAWMKELQGRRSEGSTTKLLDEFLPRKFVGALRQQLPNQGDAL